MALPYIWPLRPAQKDGRLRSPWFVGEGFIPPAGPCRNRRAPRDDASIVPYIARPIFAPGLSGPLVKGGWLRRKAQTGGLRLGYMPFSNGS